MNNLSSLINRLRRAEGPSLELDNRIHAWLQGHTGFEWLGHYYNCDQCPTMGGDRGQGVAPVTSSVNSALDLVVRLLPGWVYCFTGCERRHFARLNSNQETLDSADWHEAKTLPLAILVALFEALSSQSTTEEG